MKKFLAFLLIAVIACTTVEYQELDGILDPIKKIIEKAIKFLQEHGIYEQVKETLIDLGKEAAIGLCAQLLDRSTCKFVIDFLIK